MHWFAVTETFLPSRPSLQPDTISPRSRVYLIRGLSNEEIRFLLFIIKPSCSSLAGCHSQTGSSTPQQLLNTQTDRHRSAVNSRRVERLGLGEGRSVRTGGQDRYMSPVQCRVV